MCSFKLFIGVYADLMCQCVKGRVAGCVTLELETEYCTEYYVFGIMLINYISCGSFSVYKYVHVLFIQGLYSLYKLHNDPNDHVLRVLSCVSLNSIVKSG